MKLKAVFLFLFFCCVSPFGSQAQKLVLTSKGMRSSDNTESKYVEYVSSRLNQEELFEHCSKKLSGFEYLSYTVERTEDRQITVDGYIDGAGLLVFGKTEIRFRLCLEFEDHAVKASADLRKTNDKELNFSSLFTKKGTVRLAAPKNLIESEINALLRKILNDTVEMK